MPDDATMSPKEIDKFAETSIAEKKAFDYHDWLSANYRNHNGLGVTQSRLRELSDDFTVAGGKSVWCAAIDHQDDDLLCTRLIVEMPDDPAKRAHVLRVRDHFEAREDPSKDGGGKYITVLVNESKLKKH